MLTIKDAHEGWQFAKVLNIYDGSQRFPAMILSLKEFHTNALLFQRVQSLVGKQLKFEMPSSFIIKTSWGQN